MDPFRQHLEIAGWSENESNNAIPLAKSVTSKERGTMVKLSLESLGLKKS